MTAMLFVIMFQLCVMTFALVMINSTLKSIRDAIGAAEEEKKNAAKENAVLLQERLHEIQSMRFGKKMT